MSLSRRDFFKFGIAAGSSALFGWVVSRGNQANVKGVTIPGSGPPDHFPPEAIDAIDVDAFLGACARCGVCIAECPFNAIKSTGWQLPQLTKDTREKCPGMDNCGVCIAVCPTSALSQAYAPLKDLGYVALVEKDPWWEGKHVNKELIVKGETEEG